MKRHEDDSTNATKHLPRKARSAEKDQVPRMGVWGKVVSRLTARKEKTEQLSDVTPVGLERPSIQDLTDTLPRHPRRRYPQRYLSDIQQVVVHHVDGNDVRLSVPLTSVTPQYLATYAVEDLGWPGIGFHFVVSADGIIFQSNSLASISHHAAQANSQSVGVCFLGTFDAGVPPPVQLRAGAQLIAWLLQELNIKLDQVVGHHEVLGEETVSVTGITCPGRQWLEGKNWKNLLLREVESVRTHIVIAREPGVCAGKVPVSEDHPFVTEHLGVQRQTALRLAVQNLTDTLPQSTCSKPIISSPRQELNDVVQEHSPERPKGETGSVSAIATPIYNVATIRKLLLDAFTAEELRRFCHDRRLFRPIINRFGLLHGFDDMVDEVIVYCEKRLLFFELLLAVQEENPRQYQHYYDYLHEEGKESGTITDGIWHLAPFTVPFVRNPDFVGRDDSLEQLHETLSRRSSVRQPVGLFGTGGIGKTQMTVEYAYRYRMNYPGGIFWISAGESLTDELAAIGRALPGRNHDQPETALVCLAASYLRSHSDSLVILDNVTDPTILASPLDDGLVFTSLPGSVLFTTRSCDLHFETQEVTALPQASALTLLLRHPARHVVLNPVHREHEDAQAICSMLGCLPLALEIAGAHLGMYPQASLASYRQSLLRRGTLSVLQGTRSRIRSDQLHSLHEMAAAITFAEQWEGLSNDARLLFRIAGQLPKAMPIPISRICLLAEVGEQEDDFFGTSPRSVIDELVSGSLVERLREGHIRVHPLLHDFAAQRTPIGETAAFRLQCAASLLRAYESIAIAEEQCAKRGFHEIEQDLLDTLSLLSTLPTLDRVPHAASITPGPHLAPSSDLLTTRIQALLNLFQRESHVLRNWNREVFPGAFAQQIHWRAATLGLKELAAQALVRLDELELSRMALQWRIGPELTSVTRTLTGHGCPVRAVAITSDNQRIVSGASDGAIKVWSFHSGREERTLIGHAGAVHSVVVTPNGRFIASAGADCTVRLWDSETGDQVYTFYGHEGGVWSTAVTPDGHFIVSGSADCTVRVWHLESKKEKLVLQGHSKRVAAVAITLDGQCVISGSDDGYVKVWGLDKGTEYLSIQLRDAMVTSVAMTPDGRRIVSGGWGDSVLATWDLETGQNERTWDWSELEDEVGAVTITSCGQCLVAHALVPVISAWNLETGEEEYELRGHADCVRAVATTRDGKYVVSASDDCTVKIWDISLKVAGQKQNFDRWRMPVGATGVTGIGVTADGRHVIFVSEGRLKILDARDGDEVAALDGPTSPICSAKLTPDDRCIVTGHYRGFTVWSVEARGALYSVKGHEKEVSAITMTRDGRHVLCGSRDNTITMWNVETRQEELRLDGHSGWISDIGLTTDGRYAVSGSHDGTLRLWDLRTGSEVNVLYRHKGIVTSVVVLPDDYRVACSSSDGTIGIWNLKTMQGESTLYGHTQSVKALAITTDGHRILSGGEDHFLCVWNTSTGELAARVALEAPVEAVATGPGSLILAGDVLGNMYCLRYLEGSSATTALRSDPFCG